VNLVNGIASVVQTGYPAPLDALTLHFGAEAERKSHTCQFAAIQV
jgi:hypothetical protein